MKSILGSWFQYVQAGVNGDIGHSNFLGAFFRGSDGRRAPQSPSGRLRVQRVWERRGHAREQAFPWSYSYLNATMGSTDDARLAGISAAHADVRIKSNVTPAKIRGL